MEHHKGHCQQVEEIRHCHITKYSVSKFDKMTRLKFIREAANRLMVTLEEMQAYLANTSHYVLLTTVSCILPY